LNTDQRMDMATHGDKMTAPTQIRMVEDAADAISAPPSIERTHYDAA
jgi:hypothetical protein